jgi:hypothetical protein
MVALGRRIRESFLEGTCSDLPTLSESHNGANTDAPSCEYVHHSSSFIANWQISRDKSRFSRWELRPALKRRPYPRPSEQFTPKRPRKMKYARPEPMCCLIVVAYIGYSSPKRSPYTPPFQPFLQTPNPCRHHQYQSPTQSLQRRPTDWPSK